MDRAELGNVNEKTLDKPFKRLTIRDKEEKKEM